MLMVLCLLLALLPWANAQSTSASQGTTSNSSITLQSPGDLASCSTVNIAWFAFGLTGARVPFTINYTNEDAGQTVAKVISGIATTVTDATAEVAAWKVNIPTAGLYILTGSAAGVEVFPSSSFTVTVSNTSCFNAQSTTASSLTPTPTPRITTSSLGTSTKPLSAPLAASTTSSASSDPSEVPVGITTNNSRIAGVVGGSFGAAILVALVVACFFYRRQQSRKARAPKPEKPISHRRWGGLSSVDSTAVLDGFPAVPYTAPAYANSRGESVNKTTVENETVEKGSSPVREGESPADEVPTLSPRSHSRYSNGTLSATLAQQSGLAAFNNERARSASLKTGSPATSFVEDPFSDNSPRARGFRSQSLSVPSTAHASPRSTNGPTLSATPPIPGGLGTPRISENTWSDSSGANGNMRRSTSANAVVRPARKPVPQYDPSIEMTTTISGAHSSYSQHSAQHSVTNLTSDSHTMLGSSVDSTSPWLAPVANRNIGLASQGDGPVHYLMPDMPPPPRG